MIDTYWSDHCRHTTFLTTVDSVKFEDEVIDKAYRDYLNAREFIGRKKPENLMDVGTIAAKLLKKEGCDLVVALTHLGYEGEDYTDFELAAATRNIDVIVGGHSHTYIEEMGIAKNLDGKKVVIVTDGKWGLNIGKLTVK
jgi:phosphoribosylformylglycinamidine (FGAM) synthase-like enzyme